MAIKIYSSEQSIKRRNIDLLMLGAIGVLALFGLVIIISAVSGLSFGPDVVKRHLIALPMAAAAFIFGWMFNYQIYNEQYKAIYIMILGLLGAVLLFAVEWYRMVFKLMHPVQLLFPNDANDVST
jgi:cell division protein FtsW (lipid II flippase)